jgi:hypothetical protein
VVRETERVGFGLVNGTAKAPAIAAKDKRALVALPAIVINARWAGGSTPYAGTT